MSRLEQYRLGIARFLFSLYLAVLVNGVVFRHAHRLADGTIICHAHPYKSSPGTQFPSHTHSSDELIWLNAFANALYADPTAFVWVAAVTFVLLSSVKGSVLHQVFRPSTHLAFRHRGPPMRLV